MHPRERIWTDSVGQTSCNIRIVSSWYPACWYEKTPDGASEFVTTYPQTCTAIEHYHPSKQVRSDNEEFISYCFLYRSIANRKCIEEVPTETKADFYINVRR